MAKKPLTLTLVIPAYNEEFHINACLDSIASQDEKPDQVIVVDNNSRDNTAKVATSYPFVKVVHESQQGIVHARNAGFDAVRTDLIARIDADSVLPSDWVRKVKQHYDENGRQKYVAVTGPSYFSRNLLGQLLWYPVHRLVFFWPSRLITGHHTLSGSNMYITRSLWLKIRKGICVRTDIHEDMDLAVHAYQSGADVQFSRAFHNSMLGRKLAFKLRYYLLMWWRIMFVKHAVYRIDTESDEQPSAYKTPIVMLNYWKYLFQVDGE